MLMNRKVLFLCTGNSCRSQMAEAIVNAQLGEEWEAFRVGTHPAGFCVAGCQGASCLET